MTHLNSPQASITWLLKHQVHKGNSLSYANSRLEIETQFRPTDLMLIHSPTPPEGHLRLTKQGATMLEDLTSLATRAGIKQEILCCENIIVLGINQSETEAKIRRGFDIRLDLETQAQLSHALLTAYTEALADLTPLNVLEASCKTLKQCYTKS